MAGIELVAKLLAIRPDIPIIITTGHNETVSERSTGRGSGCTDHEAVRSRGDRPNDTLGPRCKEGVRIRFSPTSDRSHAAALFEREHVPTQLLRRLAGATDALSLRETGLHLTSAISYPCYTMNAPPAAFHEALPDGPINGGKKMMLPQVKKILYATDLTENSSYAFYFAADLARKHDAKIVILHCIPSIPPAVYYEGGLALGNRTLKKIKDTEKEQDIDEIKRRLRDFCRRVESEISPPCVDLVSDVIVKEGYAPEEILSTADAEGCDMIVLGTHGKGLLKQAFLGSVARSVLERTRKPVFIAPIPSEKPGTEWAGI